MKRTSRLSALCIAGSFAVVVAASAQDASQATQQQTQITQQTTQVSTINGKVVRYEPGKTIVVLGPDNKEVTYTLSSTANVPADVEVGRVVSLSTEPSPNGPALVTRVTVRSMTPDGKMKTETQTQSTDMNGNQSMTKVTTVTGHGFGDRGREVRDLHASGQHDRRVHGRWGFRPSVRRGSGQDLHDPDHAHDGEWPGRRQEDHHDHHDDQAVRPREIEPSRIRHPIRSDAGLFLPLTAPLETSATSTRAQEPGIPGRIAAGRRNSGSARCRVRGVG